MSDRWVIVALATAWGARFGGINAFNTEIVKSLGILPERDYDLFCVVPGAAPKEQIEECLRFGVELRGIDGATGIVRDLDATVEPERFLWVGHDDKTGPLALELRQLVPGSRTVLINHMAHCAYQSVKKGNSVSSAKKVEAQHELFRRADLCLAVGPMLCSHLGDLLGTSPNHPPIEMLVPGLADTTEWGVDIRDSPPENYVAFVAGRLTAEDERIKQGQLALRAFGNAVVRAGQHSAIRKSPKLRMRGVRASDEPLLRDLLMAEAQGAVAFDFQDYTEDRQAYFGDLASASVALMPSWHEGFGLTAWEAIASAVPVVISEQSGVYRLLDQKCSGAGLGRSVAAVQVAGWVPSSEGAPNHTVDDVVRVADALLDFGSRSREVKQEAVTLRQNLLTLGYDWKGCANTFIEAVQKHMAVRLTIARVAIAPLQASPPVPIDQAVPLSLRLPEPRPWNQQFGFTSALLIARDEVVRFDPERQPILDSMLQWSSAAPPLMVRLLFGPGGMGKTRLALEFARQLQRSGWLSVWLPTSPPAGWESILQQRDARPTLVVIDYADARPAAALAAVGTTLESLRNDNPSPVRLLLLARSESWAETLAQHPNCSQEVAAWLPGSIESVQLPSWSDAGPARRASYQAALEDYAAAMGQTPPPKAYVPDLGDKVFERPLYLHLAALAALEGQRPASAEALLRDQLLREWRYWCRMHGDELATYDEWADALAYVALRQGAPRSELPSLLAKALLRSYPAGDDHIAPLAPDLIAEALVRERLAGRHGAEVLERALAEDSGPPRAIPIIARLAAHSGKHESEDAPSAWAAVLIGGITRHWPRHPNAWLAAAHRAEFGLGRVLHSAWQQLDVQARTFVAAELDLPLHSTNLLDLTVAVGRHRVSNAREPEEKASALNDLSVGLANRGDAASLAEALTAVRDATEIYRQLGATRFKYLPYLALSLNNLGLRLAEQGDAGSRAEAVAAAREAVQTFRQLARMQADPFVPMLATSLNNLSNHLSEQGDATSRAESLATARESVQIHIRLAKEPPDARRYDRALSLNSLANRLGEQGDAASLAESLAAAREAARLFRQLAETQPAAYLPNLAMSLNNLGVRLSVIGDADAQVEALSLAREAVDMYRKLRQIHATAYLPGLALSLNSVAGISARQRDSTSSVEMLEFAREATQIYRHLVETQPAYLADLAKSLTNLSVHLSAQSDAVSRTETLAFAREAVQIYRQVTALQPSIHLSDFAASLNNLAAATLSEQSDTDLHAEGLGAARDAVQVCRQLADAQPAACFPNLPISLVTLADALARHDDTVSRAEALAAAREAVTIFTRFHKSLPGQFEHNLEFAVKNLRLRAAENGRDPDEEVRAAKAAIADRDVTTDPNG